jgi:hypothetical protein
MGVARTRCDGDGRHECAVCLFKFDTHTHTQKTGVFWGAVDESKAWPWCKTHRARGGIALMSVALEGPHLFERNNRPVAYTHGFFCRGWMS